MQQQTPEALLFDLRQAYHRIVTGQSVSVVIDQNGERVEFQKANISALMELIRKTELELAQNTTRGLENYRPLRHFF